MEWRADTKFKKSDVVVSRSSSNLGGFRRHGWPQINSKLAHRSWPRTSVRHFCLASRANRMKPKLLLLSVAFIACVNFPASATVQQLDELHWGGKRTTSIRVRCSPCGMWDRA